MDRKWWALIAMTLGAFMTALDNNVGNVALPTIQRELGLTISGLMCVPPAEVEAAPYFALLVKLAREHGLPLLSMGMSDDFVTAVMLGATHVRVGSALFGARA